jgi:antitoxin (DNA-binding transcriptional repressor) of toxin-antitoxin stability system
MRRISIRELERRLANIVAEVEGGRSFLVTRGDRIVARLVPPTTAHLHVGSRYGTGELEPLLRGPTKGRFLEVIVDDRGGRRDPR